jgi:hypothetical protein
MEDKDKTVTIIVNDISHPWSEKKITHAQVVTLDEPGYSQHPEITYSVKYPFENGHGLERVLAMGASVEVKNHMIFTVAETAILVA